MDLPKPLNKTLIIMKLMAYINYVLAILIILLSFITIQGEEHYLLRLGIMVMSGVFTFAFGLLYSKVHTGLQNGKYWAWITGIILSGFMLPSLLIFLGIPSLIGLLDKESKAFFDNVPDRTELANV